MVPGLRIAVLHVHAPADEVRGRLQQRLQHTQRVVPPVVAGPTMAITLDTLRPLLVHMDLLVSINNSSLAAVSSACLVAHSTLAHFPIEVSEKPPRTSLTELTRLLLPDPADQAAPERA